MDLTHSFTVPTSVDDAWELFMDLEKVGGCFPGATVTEVNDDGFSGTVKVKLGPIALVYSGSGSFIERDDAAHRAVISAKGKDKRGNGTAGATVTIELTPDGTGARADVVTDLAVTGKPAQFGRGVMQDVSDKLLQAFVACIEKQLGGVDDAAEPASVAVTPEASGSTDVADDVSTAPLTTVGATPARVAEAPTSGPAAPAAPVVASPPRRVAPVVEDDDALDLGSAVMPVLMKRYLGYAAAAAVGLVLGVLIGRSRA